MKINGNLDISEEEIAEVCRKWRVTEFALFGSVLREDFRSDSDIDVLVTFDDGARWDLFDIVDMQEELEALFGRKVDLAERSAVEQNPNYLRRRRILKSAQTVYAAG